MTVLERELEAEQVLSAALEEYAGRWVAVSGQRVVADADTVEDLLGEIRQSEIQVDRFFHVPQGDAVACFY
jgi:hypothetical protein